MTNDLFPPSSISRRRSTSQSSASRCWKEEVNYKTGAFVHPTADQILKCPFFCGRICQTSSGNQSRSFQTAPTCPHHHSHGCCFMIYTLMTCLPPPRGAHPVFYCSTRLSLPAAKETDTHKLWRNIEPHLKKAMQTVYLREVSRFDPSHLCFPTSCCFLIIPPPPSLQWEQMQQMEEKECGALRGTDALSVPVALGDVRDRCSTAN